MKLGKFKAGIFVLEGLNSFATSFFFNYLFFYLHRYLGLSSFDNLLFGALNGLVYMIAAYFGGLFGQKHGYFLGLRIGFGLMAASLIAGSFLSSPLLLGAVMVFWTLGMCFTWPTLEALISEKEAAARLPKRLGVYNVVWSGASAFAYFCGGSVVEHFGWKIIFWLPIALHVIQLLLTLQLASDWQKLKRADVTFDQEKAHLPHQRHPQAKEFLKMAWFANPFAYIAINGAIPLMPDLAERLQLSPRFAGFFCSIWFFARMLTFVLLGLWPGWHYRLSWLISSYIGVLVAFTGMFLAQNLPALIAFQLLFGWSMGFIYYSSLYYSMNSGGEKGAHGGLHEAALGIGIFGGPAIGALSLQLFPAWKQSSIYGVALILAAGFIGLLSMSARLRK
jgi:MFS family permease